MAGVQSETHQPVQLIAGNSQLLSETVNIAANQGALPRGSVLGRITATGLYALTDTAPGDGREAPRAILAEDTANSTSPQTRLAYVSGSFNEDAISTALTIDDAFSDALRDLGIFLS